ncbi:MAG: TetR/AcrR family transcriptional regulator [Chitinophagaceae bacterium]
MGRKSLKTTRQKEIIKTFYKVAKKEGLENASIAKVAVAMNINPSLVLHYFQTKEKLIYGLIEYILEKYLLIYKVNDNSGQDAEGALFIAVDNIFSKKWNSLFDDGVSYSCFSLAFRDKKIKKKYKVLLDTLRKTLENLISNCVKKGIIDVKDPAFTADLIFVLVDGAYYYLSLVDDKIEYRKKLELYKDQAIKLLKLHDYASLGQS